MQRISLQLKGERERGEGEGDEHKEFIRYYQERGSSSTPLVVAAV